MDDLTRFAIGWVVLLALFTLVRFLRGRALRVICGLIFIAIAIASKDA